MTGGLFISSLRDSPTLQSMLRARYSLFILFIIRGLFLATLFSPIEPGLFYPGFPWPTGTTIYLMAFSKASPIKSSYSFCLPITDVKNIEQGIALTKKGKVQLKYISISD